MDTSAPDIQFDKNGVCNYCREYFNLINQSRLDEVQSKELCIKITNQIKKMGKDKDYDCILGVSGGLDSSFTLYIAKKLGLRPLAVHLDNGWNSELAVRNIEKLVKTLDADLYTYVIDWQEFKDLQISFFRSNVIDVEMLTDHAIIATLYKVAFDKKIKYILAGTNRANEGMKMPHGWNHWKLDSRNIKSIYKKFGRGKKIRSFPTIGVAKYLTYRFIGGTKWVSILDYIPYRKDEAIKTLSKEICWKPYEKKHYESVFTRFYQGYILPNKFRVDKRRVHFSTLICSGEISREEALDLMGRCTYEDELLLQEDLEYVRKKLDFSSEQFEKYLNTPGVEHNYYASNKWIYDKLVSIKKLLSRKFVSRAVNSICKMHY